MINFSLDEAVLFRALSGLFGGDHVIPHMSVTAVCGGELPPAILSSSTGLLAQLGLSLDLERWAKKNKCLFTIVDREGDSKLVVEFAAGFADSIDPIEVEHERFLRPILAAAGISYVTLSRRELSEALDPGSSIDFPRLLEFKATEAGLFAE